MIAAALLFVQCGSDDGTKPGPDEYDNNKIEYDFATELEYGEALPADAEILVITTEQWTATVTDAATGAVVDWIAITPSTGSGDMFVGISNTHNYGYGRSAKVTFGFETSSKELTVTQKGYKDNVADIPGWTELPKITDSETTYFIAHYSTLNGERVRNYSMLYDAATYTSYWVAYPLHKDYINGDGSRKDKWRFDPSLPESLQTSVAKAYDEGGVMYNRGHQLPAGDRGTQEMIDQTFYATNSTPQRPKLNGGQWSSLEGRLNAMAKSLTSPGRDTVWVVTGAIIRTDGGNEEIVYVTNRNDQKEVPVPNYYYKVALMHKADTYTTVACWIPHYHATEQITDYKAYICSVSEVEQKTGFTFFPTLDPAVQSEIKNLSVAQMKTDWGIK